VAIKEPVLRTTKSFFKQYWQNFANTVGADLDDVAMGFIV
jgi:hypothetical protein